MYDQLSAAPQASGGENFRQKASFRDLPDGRHEHHPINLRTGVTVSDIWRNFIKAECYKLNLLQESHLDHLVRRDPEIGHLVPCIIPDPQKDPQ